MKTANTTQLFKIHPHTGLTDDVEFIASPNFDERPSGVLPDLIVVHGISLPPKQFGSSAITQLFTNQLNPADDPYFEQIKTLKVSAHALIRRDGRLVQYVPFHLRAWHAGASHYQGRNRCNDFSIGVELEGSDETCYTATQYQTLAKLIKSLWLAYPSLNADSDTSLDKFSKDYLLNKTAFNKPKVVGHSEIAPGRKTDPGVYFNWPALWRLLDLS